MSSETDYGWGVVRAGKDKFWSDAWMEMSKEDLDHVKPMKFEYGSPYRPLGRTAVPGAESYHVGRGTRSFVFAKEPLGIEAVYRYELVPVSSQAIGQYIIDLAAAEKKPVELQGKTGVHAAVLFKNPRGKWQLSFFDQQGPSGHREARTDVAPELANMLKPNAAYLVYEAWLEGYRTFAPGMVDSMAENFDPEALDLMSKGFGGLGKASKWMRTPGGR